MAEQFIKAFGVDVRKLDAVVGSKDAKLLAKLLEDDLAEEVGELEEVHAELEQVLREILFGKLVAKREYTYRRVLELVAGVVGRPLPEEATMPGRGWQDIAPLWEEWGAPTLTKVWGGAKQLAWPLAKMKVRWPIAYVVGEAQTARIGKELAKFHAGSDIPEGIPRFSEGEWELDDLQREVESIAAVVRTWCRGDILVWHDGQQ